MRLLVLVFSFFTFLPSSPVIADSECQLPKNSFHKLNRTLFYAEIKEERIFWSNHIPVSRSYLEFRKWANLQPNLSPSIAKVRAARVAHEHAGSSDYVVERFKMVEAGQLGEVTEVRCLEALLFAYANSRRRQSSSPYEMGALILAKELGRERLLKIYLVLSDATSVSFEAANQLASQDVYDHWVMLANLHSHPFSIRRRYMLHSGYTSPSDGDTLAYLNARSRFGLQEAWITNGVNTFRIMQRQFDEIPKPIN